MVSQPSQGAIPPGSAHLKVREGCKQKKFNTYIAPWRPKTQKCLENRELNQARLKPDTADQPVKHLCTYVCECACWLHGAPKKYLVPTAALDPRLGYFMENLPPLTSVFNGSHQTITSQPGPLRYVILPTCSWSSSSSLTRSTVVPCIISFSMQLPSFHSTWP